MDTDQLLAFERIVREGSFSRAARALNIAQPSISARIQALEQEVGGPLFLRSGRKITLSSLGSLRGRMLTQISILYFTSTNHWCWSCRRHISWPGTSRFLFYSGITGRSPVIK